MAAASALLVGTLVTPCAASSANYRDVIMLTAGILSTILQFLAGSPISRRVAMPDILITGKVENTGGASFPLDVSYEVLLGDVDSGMRLQGEVRTQPHGAFSIPFPLTHGEAQGLSAKSLFSINLRAFAPGAPNVVVQALLPEAEPRSDIPAHQQILDEARVLAQGVTLRHDFSGTLRWEHKIVPQNITALDAGEPVTIEILEDRRGISAGADGSTRRAILASTPARRDENGQYAASLLLPDDAFNGAAVWLRVRKGKIVPPSQSARIPGGVVLARTRVQPTGHVPATSILIKGFTESLKFGDVVAQVPEEGVSSGFTFRDVHLRFSDGIVKVSGYIGKENAVTPGTQIFQIGRFEAEYSLSYAVRDEEPFHPDDLSTLVLLTTVRREFDLFPETDLDEAVGAFGDAESMAARYADDVVKAQVYAKIIDKIKKVLEDQFSEIRSKLDNVSEDPDEPDVVVAEIRDTFFIQPGVIGITSNEITFTGISGIWHWTADLSVLSAGGRIGCPGAVVLATMAPLTYLPSLLYDRLRTLAAIAAS
jgi:hypothetical protein